MKNLRNKKCFIFDMDGTIYLGDKFIDGAVNLFNHLDDSDIRFLFLTNNSSKNKGIYQEKLKNMGYPVTQDKIFTSGEATRLYIKKRNKDAKIFLLGNEHLEQEFIEDNFTLIKEKDKDIDYVVLGFDTTLTYDKIWTASDYIKSGVTFLATHPDNVCPLPKGKTMPDTGAMIKMFEFATEGKTPKIIGKPNKMIIDVILDKYDLKHEEIVMIGDRIYTDIKLGENANIDSILVLSGEAQLKDLDKTDIKPTYIYDSVKMILQDLTQ